MLVQIYVDEIIFRTTNPTMVADFVKMIVSLFRMSMNRGLSFILELQVKQTNTRIFIHHEK